MPGVPHIPAGQPPPIGAASLLVPFALAEKVDHCCAMFGLSQDGQFTSSEALRTSFSNFVSQSSQEYS